MSGKVHPLRSYREKHDISLAALAKKADTTRQSLFRIEAGQQTPSLDLIMRICAATKGALSANDFVRGL